MRRLWAAALWLFSGLGYLVTEAVVAGHVPGYTYAGDFISDLGRPDYSAMATWMNGAFIQQGVAFALAGALACTTVRRGPGSVAFVCLAVVYGVGSTMVAVFHGRVGEPGHAAHVTGAVSAIVGANLSLITAGAVLLRRRRGSGFGMTSVALGATGLFCGGLLLINGAADNVVPFGAGVWERGSVYPIIVWQLVAGVLVVRRALRRNRHHPGADIQ